MKTKFLPAVVGAMLASGLSVAQADVTLFGHIDVSIDATDQDGGSDDINLNSNTSSIGFKGSEDLGNGLQAIFSLDFQYDITDANGSSLSDRDQWVGLAGGFGSVKAGTISTVYKSHGAMIDPLYRTALQGRGRGLQSDFHNGAGDNLQGRADNTLRYDSPSWNGLQVGAFYTLDSDEDTGISDPANPGSNLDEDNDSYGAGVSYTNGGIIAFADYQDNNGSSSDVGGDINAWKVGGKYTMGMFGLYGQYEDASVDENYPGMTTPVDYDLSVWHFGASASLGNTMAYFAYGQGEYDNAGGVNNEYTSWTLALMHSLSKRTSLYTGFNEVDCDYNQPNSSACKQVGSSGGEDDKFSIGMKHKF